ncbi:MAG: class I SAM-dependent methyltransferase [Clostridium sp.]|nr:class I SAM-dependent methyltransferase [Clostridium sp.]
MNHYYSKDPETTHDFCTINYLIGKVSLTFNTDSCVFSKRKVDFGSNLLINSIPPLSSCKILDMGCGYGAIGISISKLNPSCSITMVDINSRAVELAKKNIDINQIVNASASQSDGFSDVKGSFDLIVSNPPIRIGKKIMYRIFEDSINFLAPGGTLYLVIQKKQGAKSAVAKLESIFQNCEVVNKSGGYWIIKSCRRV